MIHPSRLHGRVFLAMLLALSLCGCVERRMIVRSNPPGALLYVDDHEIGMTPIATHFTYYGTRKFKLVKDGYETLTVNQSIPPPWYEFVPLDFVAENFVPGTIRDYRTIDLQMKPQAVVPTEQLISRAEALRRGVQATVPPVGPTAPGVVGPGMTPLGSTPYPQPPPMEVLPTPEGVGGQPIHPLPGRQW